MADEPKPVGVIPYDLFTQIDLRVGTIDHAEPVAGADKLLKLRVNLGPLGERTILAGIKLQYNPELLVGRQIIVVANLEPRKMRGEMSHGMLLAASNEDHSDLSLLAPDKKFPPGSKVS